MGWGGRGCERIEPSKGSANRPFPSTRNPCPHERAFFLALLLICVEANLKWYGGVCGGENPIRQRNSLDFNACDSVPSLYETVFQGGGYRKCLKGRGFCFRNKIQKTILYSQSEPSWLEGFRTGGFSM